MFSNDIGDYANYLKAFQGTTVRCCSQSPAWISGVCTDGLTTSVAVIIRSADRKSKVSLSHTRVCVALEAIARELTWCGPQSEIFIVRGSSYPQCEEELKFHTQFLVRMQRCSLVTLHRNVATTGAVSVSRADGELKIVEKPAGFSGETLRIGKTIAFAEERLKLIKLEQSIQNVCGAYDLNLLFDGDDWVPAHVTEMGVAAVELTKAGRAINKRFFSKEKLKDLNTEKRQEYIDDTRACAYLVAPLLGRCDACHEMRLLVELKQCSRCKKRSYCGVGCQKQDWATHKLECKAP